jgi:zinc protease
LGLTIVDCRLALEDMKQHLWIRKPPSWLLLVLLLAVFQQQGGIKRSLCEGLTPRTEQDSTIANLQSSIGNLQGITEVKLDNGLKVLLREVHTTPLVSIGCWYRVGSRDEEVGTTGISHWVEHMNFKGTQNLPKGRMAGIIDDAGGYWNGYTSLDQTTYFETMAASSLEDVLKLEAERMTLSLFEAAEVTAERTVVISELQGIEDNPKDLLDRDVTAAALKVHPYRLPTGGWLQDLEGLTREQLYRHYQKYYTPNNAILVVVGDFKTSTALELIRKQFGKIPRKPDPVRRKTIEPEQEGEKRIKILREGATPYLQVAYPAPDILNDDFYPFLILDAALLGAKGMNLWSSPLETDAGKSSRLYRALIDKKLATHVNSALVPTQDPYLYKLTLTLPDTFQFQPAEEVIYEELEKIKNYGITSYEFDKARNQLLAQMFLDQDTPSKLAHQLGYFESIASYQFLNSLEDKISKVSQDDLRRVTIKYFSDRARTVGLFVPLPKQQKIEVEKLSTQKQWKEKTPGRAVDETRLGGLKSIRCTYHGRLDPSVVTAEGAKVQWVRPKITLKLKRQVLPNGVVIMVGENHASPTVAVLASIKAGAMRDSDENAGIANFVGLMLEHGTKAKSVSHLAEDFDFLGAHLRTETDYLVTSLLVEGLKKDLGSFVALLAEMFQSPSFPQSEIEKVKAEIISELREESEDPATVAEQVLRERIYPRGHPFRRMANGSARTVEKLKPADLLSFYKRTYRPDEFTIIVAGDVDPEEVFALVGKHFDKWAVTGEPEAFSIAPVSIGLGEGNQIVPLRNKSQCDIVLGIPGISIRSPDYYPMLVLNQILGQAGLGGRLGNRIRDQEGLAYDVSASFDASLSEGPFMIRAGASPQQVDRVVTLMREEIEKMKSGGVSEQEISAAKRYLVTSLPVRLESNEAIAREFERIELFQLGEDYLLRYPDLIDGVRLDQLLDCVRTRLAFEKGALVVAGPYEPQ